MVTMPRYLHYHLNSLQVVILSHRHLIYPRFNQTRQQTTALQLKIPTDPTIYTRAEHTPYISAKHPTDPYIPEKAHTGP